MNDFCNNCKNSCEEVIPTFNCKFQMEEKKELLIEFLNEFKNVHATMYHNVDAIINELSNTKPEIVREVLTRDIGDLEFNERGAAYEREFGLGNLGSKIDNKLILVSLICSFVLAARKKDPAVTVLDCVKKLTDYESLSMTDKTGMIGKYYENLAIICESFLYGVSEGNTFGLKTAADLKLKVNDILSTRVPF